MYKKRNRIGNKDTRATIKCLKQRLKIIGRDMRTLFDLFNPS